MELTKISETIATITLRWSPVAGAVGYRFTSERQPKPSHTWNPERDRVEFAKGSAWYKVEALGVESVGQYPPTTPPPPGLPFPEPALVNPIQLTVPTNYSSGRLDADFELPEANRDYLINLERQPRHGLVLRGPRGGADPVGNVRVLGSHFRCEASEDQSSYRRGGLRIAIRAQRISIPDYYVQALDVPGSTQIDGLGLACAHFTTVTVQRFLIEGRWKSADAAAHADAIQVQGSIGKLELGLGTIYMTGHTSHPGKGLQLDELPWGGDNSPGPFLVDVRSVDFEGLGIPGESRSTFVAVQGTRGCGIRWQDAWVRTPDGQETDFPAVLIYQGDASHNPAISGAKPNRSAEWRNAATNIQGVLRERAAGSHFVTREMLGYS